MTSVVFMSGISTLDLRERLLRYLLSVTETGGEVREDSNVSILS